MGDHDGHFGGVNELVRDTAHEHASQARQSTPPHDDEIRTALVRKFSDLARDVAGVCL